MRLSNKTSPYWILLALTVSGCLPSSCTRIESRDITQADSLSRAIARVMTPDTLTILDVIASEDNLLAHPRTLGYDPMGVLWVTDTGNHTLLSFDERGELVSADTLQGIIPYLAGFTGDSVYVYSPLDHSVYMRNSTGISDPIALEGDFPVAEALSYLVRTPSGFVSKVVADGFNGYLGVHNSRGALLERVSLEGPSWRYAGLLKGSTGVVYSLAGYRPVVHRLRGGLLDSLILVGYDSPMLARSLQFLQGTTNQPPLLMASASITEDFMFVLNMRPGWLNIDVYDLEGRLQYILTQPDPSFSPDFYPSDIAVRRWGSDGFEIAVALTKFQPRIERYRWVPPARGM